VLRRAPRVLEFDADGKVLRSWGGHIENWFESEHGVLSMRKTMSGLGAGLQDGNC
jgi:hypothetical protein